MMMMVDKEEVEKHNEIGKSNRYSRTGLLLSVTDAMLNLFLFAYPIAHTASPAKHDNHAAQPLNSKAY